MRICPVCGEVTEKEIDWPVLDGSGTTIRRTVHLQCACERARDREIEERLALNDALREISTLRNLSLMDERLKGARFATYRVTEDNKKVAAIVKRYVEHFEEMYEKSQGLLFFGDVGTGKSYSAAVIANELLDRRVPVVMTSFIRLVRETRNFGKEENEYLNRLNRARLLIIDDLGAERCTDFVLEKVYDVIDSRYRSGKPLVLTTNLDFRDMQNEKDQRYTRIYDRIFEMCYPVKFIGKSWRKNAAVLRFDAMRKTVEGT